jgi:hypothetical protein
MHLLKDYITIRGYIRGTLGQPQKLAPKVGEPADASLEDDTKFSKADHCLMIFEGS